MICLAEEFNLTHCVGHLNVQPRILHFIAFLSSFAALTYETLWFRQLSTQVGSATLASSLVIGFFLFGLAMGSISGGLSVQKQKRNTAHQYAIIEIMIALCGVILFFFYENLPTLMGQLPFIFKVIISTATLIAPSYLMGMTFPLLVKLNQESQSQDASTNVYLWNTLGASAGVLCAGLYCIAFLGIYITSALAVSLNIICAILVLFCFKKSKSTDSNLTFEPTHYHFIKPIPLFILIFIFSTLSLSLEITHLKLLFLVSGSTTASFTLFLFTFLLFTSIGSAVAKKVQNLKTGLILIFTSPLLLAIGIALIVFKYPDFNYYFALYLRPQASLEQYFTFNFIISIFLLAIPCFGMGMFLPLLMKFIRFSKNSNITSVSWIYGIYGFGNMCGALISTLIFIPFFGSFGVNLFYIVTLCVLSLFCIYLLSLSFLKLAPFIVVILSLTFIIQPWNPNAVFSGGFNIFPSNEVLKDKKLYRKLSDTLGEPLWSTQGVMANVAVYQNQHNKQLIINGKTDAGNGRDMPVQVGLSVIPTIYAPQIQNKMLIIGMGSGITARASLTPPIREIKVLELLSEVIQAAKQGFKEYTSAVFNSHRVKIEPKDGLSFIANTHEKFDIVTQEPTNIWMKGSSPFFTVEHFNNVKKILTDDGIFAVWIHAYWISSSTFVDVLRTIQTVFPFIEVYEPMSNDLVIIASPQELKINQTHLRSVLDTLPQAITEPAGFSSDLALLSKMILSQRVTPQFINETPGKIFTQKMPLLEYESLRSYLAQDSVKKITSFNHRFKNPTYTKWLAKNIGKNRLTFSDERKIFHSFLYLSKYESQQPASYFEYFFDKYSDQQNTIFKDILSYKDIMDIKMLAYYLEFLHFNGKKEKSISCFLLKTFYEIQNLKIKINKLDERILYFEKLLAHQKSKPLTCKQPN